MRRTDSGGMGGRVLLPAHRPHRNQEALALPHNGPLPGLQQPPQNLPLTPSAAS